MPTWILPIRAARLKSPYVRTSTLRSYRQRNLIRKRLTSPEGGEKRKRRTADVDSVFSHIKSNRNFK